MRPQFRFRSSDVQHGGSQQGGRRSFAERGGLTQARRSMLHTASVATSYIKERLWLWPIIAVVLLSIVGFFVRGSIESTTEEGLKSELRTLLDLEVAMLRTWGQAQRVDAEAIAHRDEVRNAFEAFIAFTPQSTPATDEVVLPTREQLSNDLETALDGVMNTNRFQGYFITAKTPEVVHSSMPGLVDLGEVDAFAADIRKALNGDTVLTAPFRSVVAIETASGKRAVGEPTMYVISPIHNSSFRVVGTLGLRIDPAAEFTRILQLGRVGESGETYAINNDGVMVSNSRFDEELILLGLLPDVPGTKSILNIQVRDPGGNVTEGYRPEVRRSKLPLTTMAENVLEGSSGVNVEGYRDYRGVPVVGAWQYLPEMGIGVATEVDVAEAFQALTILNRAFWVLYALLILGAIAIFAFTLVVARLRREAQKAALEAKTLGQYELHTELGRGAMGLVYKGKHSMLRRVTAIKLLNVERAGADAIARFEREVQLTSQLSHPNTVAIYDYGRTPEGVFYYAMEYLDGIDLHTLVKDYGPQPEPRVLQILMQICGSLYEAHTTGLVHRDVKPANIMLNRRGCQPDVVKVLDFGLVKALDDRSGQNRLSEGVAGTPLYMSPEAFENPNSVDARSDLYSVGAVGYFLLTGRPVFNAGSMPELMRKQVSEEPVPPSRVVSSISEALEDAILSCLAKDRSRRPQTARELAHLLERCAVAQPWSIEEAESWWQRHERNSGIASATSGASTSASSNPAPAPTDANGQDSEPDSTSSSTPNDRTIIDPDLS